MNIFNIASIFCLAVCFVMFLYLKWYVKKRTTSSGLDERQTEVVKLIDEIDRITDRDSQLVEDRVNRLKVLLLDVDKRIALYEKEIEQLQNTQKNDLTRRPNETLYTSLGRGINAALKNVPEKEPERTAELAAVIVPVTPTAKPQAQTAKQPSKKQVRAAVDMLANEGLSAEEIASRLELSLPEVNLAIKLRRK